MNSEEMIHGYQIPDSVLYDAHLVRRFNNNEIQNIIIKIISLHILCK